jgi:hypothetical protein
VGPIVPTEFSRAWSATVARALPERRNMHTPVGEHPSPTAPEGSYWLGPVPENLAVR